MKILLYSGYSTSSLQGVGLKTMTYYACLPMINSTHPITNGFSKVVNFLI